MIMSVLRNVCKVHSYRNSSFLTAPMSICQLQNWQLLREMHRKSIYKTEEAKKIRFYVLHRYLEYLKNYDKVLERSFPGAMRVYRVFTVGISDFIKDLKNFVQIVRLLNTKTDTKKVNKFEKLNRRELELLHQMPKDMRKIAPVLLISALPFANYVIFPLAYLLPKYLLTSHFWTLQQKSEFNVDLLRERLIYNRPLFRCVQAELDAIKDQKLHDNWAEILGMLGSGVQPSVEQIIACKQLFIEEPYHLFHLKRKHIKFLLRIHDLHRGWFRRTRLYDRGVILQEMDKAIVREGGAHNLPVEALRQCCFIRGLNPTNMRTEDMIVWLNKWIKVSQSVDKEGLSLLLHCPILLAYNEPTNWLIIYKDKVIKT